MQQPKDQVQSLLQKAKELNEKEEYQQALEYYEEAKTLLDKEDIDNDCSLHAEVYEGMARSKFFLGEYEESKRYALQALIVRRKYFGKESIEIAKAYYDLAFVYIELSRYDMALYCLKRTLTIR